MRFALLPLLLLAACGPVERPSNEPQIWRGGVVGPGMFVPTLSTGADTSASPAAASRPAAAPVQAAAPAAPRPAQTAAGGNGMPVPALPAASPAPAAAPAPAAPVMRARLSDPFAVDPAQYALRLRLPEGVRLAGPVALRLTAGGTSLRYPAVVQGGALRLSASTAAQMRRGIAEAQTISGTPQLSVAATLCGPTTTQTTIGADLSLDGGASFAPLLRGASVESVTGRPSLPPCR